MFVVWWMYLVLYEVTAISVRATAFDQYTGLKGVSPVALLGVIYSAHMRFSICSVEL